MSTEKDLGTQLESAYIGVRYCFFAILSIFVALAFALMSATSAIYRAPFGATAVVLFIVSVVLFVEAAKILLSLNGNSSDD